MNNSKQLIDGALFIAIYMVLVFISLFVPFISMITILLVAVPFIIYSARYGLRPSLIMLIGASLLTMLFATFVALPLPIIAGLGGIMIGLAIKQEASPYETWARGTIGFVAGILFAFVFSLMVLHINVIEEFNQQMDEIMALSKNILTEIGMGKEVDQQFNLLEQQLAVYKQLVPFGVVAVSILLALVNQWVSYKFLNRQENKHLRFPKFRNLRFSTSIIWIYLLAVVVSVFQKDPNGTVFIAAQNIIMLVGLFLIIQGFSFIFFYAHQKNLSKAIPVIAIVVTVLFAPILITFIRLLGIIDIGFGLRDRMVKRH
ncbi:YybS family protein [Ornithinibacillus bavariensis]|uniref:YybS family protein n=1 Tax=Ornithinibacillus bavariensis TaxID=545502 RepID=UPI000EB8E8A2|nr:DUF2232 domain-containing protein [Ornithinibacillus sp.]